MTDDQQKESMTLPEEAGSHVTAYVAAALEGLDFPADKAAIMQYVQEKSAVDNKEEVITVLEKLSDQEYESPIQVMAEVPE